MLRFKDFIRDDEGYSKIERCQNCGKAIMKPEIKAKFINITQNIHYTFCNRKCKAKWINENSRLDGNEHEN